MPCYSPLKGYRSRDTNPSGKRSIVFNKLAGFVDLPVQVPCGQCIGCRLERSRQWAIRCVHESQLHEKNCFITLTFRPACPLDGTRRDPTHTLYKKYFQDFMKRLRFHYAGRAGAGIRYFHCGEYGELLQRPHHHACLFNFDFPDKYQWKKSGSHTLYRSGTLEKLWPFGYSSIGACNFETAAYVARYVTKKINGEKSAAHYSGRLPEYVTMSRRPGIANQWLKQFSSDVYPSDSIVIRENLKCKPPKYYDKIFDLLNPGQLSNIKAQRVIKIKDKKKNKPHLFTEQRLETMHLKKQLDAKKLKRSYETIETTAIKITVSAETVGATGAKTSSKKVIKYVLKTREKTLLKRKLQKCKNSISTLSMMKKLLPSQNPSASCTTDKHSEKSEMLQPILSRCSLSTQAILKSIVLGPSMTAPEK